MTHSQILLHEIGHAAQHGDHERRFQLSQILQRTIVCGCQQLQNPDLVPELICPVRNLQLHSAYTTISQIH